MKKTFMWLTLAGMAVAGALTTYAYYYNHHLGAPTLDEAVYFTMCPPSIFLILTERASVPTQTLIVTVVIILNGLLYGIIALVLRSLFRFLGIVR